MDILELQRRTPDILSWGAAAAMFFGTYLELPGLTALGFGVAGFITLMGALTGEPLGWKWIPIRLRYIWAWTLGVGLIIGALAFMPLPSFGDNRADFRPEANAAETEAP